MLSMVLVVMLVMLMMMIAVVMIVMVIVVMIVMLDDFYGRWAGRQRHAVAKKGIVPRWQMSCNNTAFWGRFVRQGSQRRGGTTQETYTGYSGNTNSYVQFLHNSAPLDAKVLGF